MVTFSPRLIPSPGLLRNLPFSRSFLRMAPPHVMGPRPNPKLGKLGPHPSTDSSEMMCQHGSFNHLAKVPPAPSSIGLLGHTPAPDHAQRAPFPGGPALWSLRWCQSCSPEPLGRSALEAIGHLGRDQAAPSLLFWPLSAAPKDMAWALSWGRASGGGAARRRVLTTTAGFPLETSSLCWETDVKSRAAGGRGPAPGP